jgi:hypothetical protein
MKEKPILMSAPMVIATLEDRKGQTRRIMKVPHTNNAGKIIREAPIEGSSHGHCRNGLWELWGPINNEGRGLLYEWGFPCPYGVVGDRLWVRETWMHGGNSAPGYARKYRADGFEVGGLGDFDGEPWRPSIFMPRWASRINLEITDVRVERLQDISEEDCIAEGIVLLNGRYTFNGGLHESRTPKESYRALWEIINGAGSWDFNPWLWCVSFRKI